MSSRALTSLARTERASSASEVVRKSISVTLRCPFALPDPPDLADPPDPPDSPHQAPLHVAAASRRYQADGERPATASARSIPMGMTAGAGIGDAVVDVALHVGPAFVDRAVDHELVDHLVGDGRERPLAVTGRPGVPHRLEGGPRPSQRWNSA